jgi:modulator of FtsH protease HflC
VAGTATAAAKRLGGTLLLLGVALLLWALYGSLFTVDVTEHGVVTRFGRVMRVVDEPGLNVKAPFDRVVRLDRRLLYSRPAQAEYLTADKKNVAVRSLATWRIADPELFLETLATRADAEVRLADLVLAEIGAVLGSHPFSSFISANGQESRFRAMIERVRDSVGAFALPTYGIQVVDVSIRQLGLPEQNKQNVFERMKAERGKMAKEFRSEGERDSQKIIAEAEREKTRLLAEAYEQAQRIRAEGEAEAMRIYAETFSQNPSFYKFLRTLQAYEKVLDGSTTLVLPTGAEILEMLHGDAPPPDGRGEHPAGSPPAPRPDELASPGRELGLLAPAPVEAGARAARRVGPASLNGGLPR